MKKAISILLALVLTLGLCIPAFAANTQDITVELNDCTIVVKAVSAIEATYLNNQLNVSLYSKDAAVEVVSGTLSISDGMDSTVQFTAGSTTYINMVPLLGKVKSGEWEGAWLFVRASDNPPESNVPFPSDKDANPTPTETSIIDTAIAHGLVPDSLKSDYQKELTRAEFCAFAVNFYESIKGLAIQAKVEITERKTFMDTNDINVQKMAGLGIVAGIGNNKFAPDNKITREEAAVIFSRLMGKLAIGLNADTTYTYSDSTATSTWAKESVVFVLDTMVMSLDTNSKFNPKGTFTREQCIEAFTNLYNEQYLLLNESWSD